LLDRLDEPRMAAEQAEPLAVGVRGKSGARRPRLLAPHLFPVGAVDRLGLVPQRGDLVRTEAIGQKQITLVVERLQLLGAQPHGSSPWPVAPIMSQAAMRCQPWRGPYLTPTLFAPQWPWWAKRE
jgi:hypothetical protein